MHCAGFLIAVSSISNPDGAIAVDNAAKFPCNVGLYKDNNLLVQQDVQIGQQAQFQLQNSLSFGVVQVFNPDNVLSPTTFDLDMFPGGLVVTLSQDPVSGEYVFTGTSCE